MKLIVTNVNGPPDTQVKSLALKYSRTDDVDFGGLSS